MNYASRRLSSPAIAVAAAIGMLFAFAFAFAFAAEAPAAKKTKRPVAVYPVPGTPVASEESEISFRGLNPKKLGKVKVFGSKSGRHGGKRIWHSDRKGVSFVPKKAFTRGEKVFVKTNLRIYNAKKGDYKFRIGDFYGKAGSDDQIAAPGEPPATDGLNSRPDLKPQEMKFETSNPSQAAPGKYFVAPRQDGMQIVDNYGRTSWFRPTNYGGKGEAVLNFQTQKLKGRPVLTYWKGASSATGFSQVGTYEILNRKYNRIATIRPGNGYRADIHEFDITPRGTALVLAYRGVKKDTSKFGGQVDGKLMDNVVQEIDIKTGRVMWEWHSIGNVPMADAAGDPPEDNTSAWDYFHVNAAKADGDSYLISGRRPSAVYRISRNKAKIRWTIRGDGQPGSSFKMGEGTSFAYQHDIRRLKGSTFSLFDNGSGRGVPTVNEESSGLIFKIVGKGKNRRVELVKRYEHPTPVVSGSQGSMDPQPNGNVVLGWGSEAQITEFNAAGDVVNDITFNDAPSSSYRAFKDSWNGIPKGRPAIASEATGGGTTVWASWNGSQKVAKWKVLTGPNAGNLSQIAEQSWADLETEIAAPAAQAVIAVQAVDRNGKVIGESAAVPVGTQNSGL